MKPIIAIPATLALCYRAYSHKSLTPAGILAAALTAIAHAVHPWNLPFVLLVVFYMGGTTVTKVKKDVKASLTLQSTGDAGGEGPRTHIQVLANSIIASVLTLLHAYQLRLRSQQSGAAENCFAFGGDLLVVGIVANYASVAADTFSSELGILSTSSPRLITSLTLRKVPRGTNGGVTAWGLIAGLLGSASIVATSMLMLPFCSQSTSSSYVEYLSSIYNGSNSSAADGSLSPHWTLQRLLLFAAGMTLLGGCGSVLDSLLGGWLQQSVVDTRTGRVVEGRGGKKVLVASTAAAAGGGVASPGPSTLHYRKRAEVKAKLLGGECREAVAASAAEGDGKMSEAGVERSLDEKMGGLPSSSSSASSQRGASGSAEGPSRAVESGLGLLDNNEVNFLMALTMSSGAMAAAAVMWDVPLSSIISA